MALLVLVIGWFSLQCFCNGQEIRLNDSGNDLDCNIIDNGNCTEVTGCIGTYYELESYVQNNREVIEKLKGAFFETGKPPSKFVKLTYNFQVSNGTHNSTEQNGTMNCTSHQRKYIWSEQFLYLLGPRSLLWSTLFAVRVSENNITITLPCLCYDTYDSLLSRLTYMVGCFSVIFVVYIHMCSKGVVLMCAVLTHIDLKMKSYMHLFISSQQR